MILPTRWGNREAKFPAHVTQLSSSRAQLPRFCFHQHASPQLPLKMPFQASRPCRPSPKDRQQTRSQNLSAFEQRQGASCISSDVGRHMLVVQAFEHFQCWKWESLSPKRKVGRHWGTYLGVLVFHSKTSLFGAGPSSTGMPGPCSDGDLESQHTHLHWGCSFLGLRNPGTLLFPALVSWFLCFWWQDRDSLERRPSSFLLWNCPKILATVSFCFFF